MQLLRRECSRESPRQRFRRKIRRLRRGQDNGHPVAGRRRQQSASESSARERDIRKRQGSQRRRGGHTDSRQDAAFKGSVRFRAVHDAARMGPAPVYTAGAGKHSAVRTGAVFLPRRTARAQAQDSEHGSARRGLDDDNIPVQRLCDIYGQSGHTALLFVRMRAAVVYPLRQISRDAFARRSLRCDTPSHEAAAKARDCRARKRRKGDRP